MNSIIFHCASPVLDADGVMVLDKKGQVIKKKITHTLVFEKINEDTLAFGWAQAHAKDSYSKKKGLEVARERLRLLINRIENFPKRKVFKLPTITEIYLPSKVLDNSFDYYLNTAVTNLLELDNINSLNLMFRSTNKEEPVCEIEIAADDIRDSINANIENSIYSAKVNAEGGTGEFIFCTYPEDGKVMVVIQSRAKYYGYGLDIKPDVDIQRLANAIVAAKNNLTFTQVENAITLVSTDRKEYDVIVALRNLGLSYDGNLESEFINDED